MNFDVPAHPLDDEAEGGIVINPHSALGKELCRWEQHQTHFVGRGQRPGNPYVFRPYPKMLYKAQRLPSGQYGCLAQAPDPYAYERMDIYQQAILRTESFNQSCTRIVKDEAEERVAAGQGWCVGPKEAMAQYEAEQQAIGNAAAEAIFQAKRMTAKAQEEFAAAEASTHQHVPDVKGTKRGPKAVVAVEEE